MNQTSINNLFRALEAKESDGTPTIQGDNKAEVISKLLARLSEYTPADVQDSLGYHVRALGLHNEQGKIITGSEREQMIASHVSVLTSTWNNTDIQAAAILDSLTLNDSFNPEIRTIEGTNRKTLKTKLIELL
ncbi:hypothetical protein LX69_01153 [Breznakibacter xylanolyticus]|uniref:Uncharacterized protein n=1 Tax=Breznakibacter xylanolyticus TaxID=990 RepID=A0A2W7NXW4_9BACT|nr:hypothetical protein [Breznakibacter xylanolyticus]PZX18116.1 hypothetical protein LX69_01153 [Breznakibacter xylanolyticus]